jgi:hypothetical protein
MVVKKLITIRRCRRVSEEPAHRSVCFQRTPKSSSCMQIALRSTWGLPRSSAMTASM